MHPAHPGRHVLQHQRHRGNQPGHKTAAGQIVATQEDIHRDQQRQRQQWPGDRYQHQRVGVFCPGPPQRIVFGRRQIQILEQGINAHGGNPQHGDLTEGIEAAEVHQNHVDHIGATAAGLAVIHKELADGSGITGHHQERHHRHASANHKRQQHIAQHPHRRRLDLGAHRQEVHGEHQQQHGHHFHR